MTRLVLLLALVIVPTAQGGMIYQTHNLRHQPDRITVRQALRENPKFQRFQNNIRNNRTIQQIRNSIPKFVNPKKLQWIFPRRLKTILNWGLDRKIPRPGRMYDTSNWNQDTLATIWYRGLRSYTLTGSVPDNPLWEYLEWRHDLNPDRFLYYHPYFTGMFDDAECIGLLPQGAWWDRLENRYDRNPTRFNLFHPGIGPIMKLNSMTVCPPIIPPNPPDPPKPPLNAVPEPSSIALCTSGATLLFLCHRRRNRSCRKLKK